MEINRVQLAEKCLRSGYRIGMAHLHRNPQYNCRSNTIAIYTGYFTTYTIVKLEGAGFL